MIHEAAEVAVGKSISFRPYSLYADAVAFGQIQTPPRSISVVVCEALDFYLAEKGYGSRRRGELAELLAAAQELGVEAASKILRDAARGAARKRKRKAARL